MTQEERWEKQYGEVVEYLNTYHRNPSKHRIEDHKMLNWLKSQRKLLKQDKVKPERKAKLESLFGRMATLKRKNQWSAVPEE